MTTKTLKLIMKVTKMTPIGDLMLMTMREWSLYKRMGYEVCSIKQAFWQAGCY